jgi:hypothetical protein
MVRCHWCSVVSVDRGGGVCGAFLAANIGLDTVWIVLFAATNEGVGVLSHEIFQRVVMTGDPAIAVLEVA